MIRRQFCREFAAAGAALMAAPFLGLSSTSVTAAESKAPSFPLPATSPVGPGAWVHDKWVPNANLWFKGGRKTHRVVEVNEFGIWYVPDDDLQVVVFQPYWCTACEGTLKQGLLCDKNLYYTTEVPVTKHSSVA